MQKSSGILMSGAMVVAWLAGLKNQTRRTRGLNKINASPDEWRFNGLMNGVAAFTRDGSSSIGIRAPYGSVGDTLYFKETWKMWEREEDGRDFLHYRADDAKIDPTWWTEDDWRAPAPFWWKKDVFTKWQPSMFMSFGCARIRNVPILKVRVERLWNITEDDAIAEGINLIDHNCYENYLVGSDWMYHGRNQLGQHMLEDPIGSYASLWDKINGKTLPFDKNPWVWVYEFQKY
jgi:hypothetical protein